ncbi:MAG TPA: glyoxalase superfamily protein [Acidimicrobiales bacterium]|nr:glyoxalase superfamily protein [Acidimicrobiales bacterium]
MSTDDLHSPGAPGRHADRFRNCAAIINVDDVAATAAWYTDVLGFDLEHGWGDPLEHASMRCGASSFHFSTGQPTTPQTSYVTVYCDDVDALHDDYAGRGVEIVMPLMDAPWGARTFMINDRDGHLLMFAAVADPADHHGS